MSEYTEDTSETIAIEDLAVIEAINLKLRQGSARPLTPTERTWAHWHIRLCDLVALLRAMGQDDAAIEAAILAGMTNRFEPTRGGVVPPLTLSLEPDEWGSASSASQ